MPIRSPGRIVDGRENRAAVEMRAVGAVEIVQLPLEAEQLDLGVAPRGAGVVDDDVGAAAAAEDDGAIEREGRARPLAILKSEDRHVVGLTDRRSRAASGRAPGWPSHVG